MLRSWDIVRCKDFGVDQTHGQNHRLWGKYGELNNCGGFGGCDYPKNSKNNFEKYINMCKWGTMYCGAHCISLEEDNEV